MDDRRYFLLKRLHSLSGVIPVAGFVMFHLFENSHSVAGQVAFNETVKSIRSQPYLTVLELGLLLPLAFHALLGLYLARTARPNVTRFPNRANISYTLQRLTGILLLFFIGFHLWTTRFAGIPTDQMFQRLAQMFSNRWIALFYTLGIFSAAFHLSNGLWGFAVAWGIVSGSKSMDLAWKACMGLGLVVFLMGMNAMAGFLGKGINVLDYHAPAASVAAPMAAAPAAAPVSVTAAAR